MTLGLPKTFSDPAKLYFLGIMFLAMTSGTALNLVVFTIPYQLSETGYATDVIGAMFLTGLPYCLKPVWAPFLDRYPVPYLCARFGQRRGWALATQIGLSFSVSILIFINPGDNLYVTAPVSFIISCFASMMDIILDAYRIERSKTPELLSGATAYGVIGMRFGMLISSAGALYISAKFGWTFVYTAELAITLIGPLVIFCVAEPIVEARHLANHMLSLKEYFATLKDSLVVLKTHQPKLLLIMLLVLLYKVSDSVPMSMSSAFFLDLSFNSYHIASYFKGYGFFVMIFGCMIGGMLSTKMGITKSLLLCGALQLLSPIMFMLLSIAGYDFAMFIVTVTVQNLVSGMAVTALSIYLSDLCDGGLVATQFSIISSFNSLSRIILSSSAGIVATYMEWTEFFSGTALLGSMFVVVFYLIYKKLPPKHNL